MILSPFFNRPCPPGADVYEGLSSRTLARPGRQYLRRLVFPVLWLFITLVSAVDTYITIKFQESLWFHEINPMARMLLRIDDWDPSLLVAVKFLGSVMVLAILVELHLQNRRIGLVVTGALASFQLLLLGYLILA